MGDCESAAVLERVLKLVVTKMEHAEKYEEIRKLPDEGKMVAAVEMPFSMSDVDVIDVRAKFLLDNSLEDKDFEAGQSVEVLDDGLFFHLKLTRKLELFGKFLNGVYGAFIPLPEGSEGGARVEVWFGEWRGHTSWKQIGVCSRSFRRPISTPLTLPEVGGRSTRVAALYRLKAARPPFVVTTVDGATRVVVVNDVACCYLSDCDGFDYSYLKVVEYYGSPAEFARKHKELINLLPERYVPTNMKKGNAMAGGTVTDVGATAAVGCKRRGAPSAPLTVVDE